MRVFGGAVFFVAFVLAGCGGGGGSAPGGPPLTPTTAAPTNSPVPTAAPTLPPSGSVIAARPATSPPMTFLDYTASGNGYGIATTSDGTVYISQGGQSRTLVRVVGTQATPIALPSPYSAPQLMTRGSDGAVWFSNQHIILPTIFGNIGRIDAAGTITEFDVPQTPFGMALGPDGNVWFVETYQGRVGRITPSGGVADYSLGAGVHRPTGIAAGNGDIWVAEGYTSTIDRITTSGTLVAQYPIPTEALWITAGSDGAMWFGGTNDVGRIDVLGQVWYAVLPCDVANVGNFCLPGYFQSVTSVTSGPDGAMWFVAQNFQAIARLTTNGGLYEFPVPPGPGGPTSPFAIAPAPGGFVISGGNNRMTRVTVP